MSPRGQRHICVSGAKLGILVTPAIAVLASGASTAAADTTINVNTPSDETTVGDGTCSLREALLFANGVQGGEDCGTGQSPGTVTILLPAQHYSLTQGVLTLERVDGQITIQGSGVGPMGTTIDAQHE